MAHAPLALFALAMAVVVASTVNSERIVDLLDLCI